MKMVQINKCLMTDCAYNTDEICHALAITVGANAPFCDTFLQHSQKGGVKDAVGSVGACKVIGCKHNDALECTADGIEVGRHADHPECDTFAPR